MFLANLLISAFVISFSAWLTQRRPDLAGFIVSLPISSLLVLTLTQIQTGDPQKGNELAKSIFVAIPSSLLFFIPFLLSNKLRIPFWVSYGSGVGLLAVAFFIHRYLFSLMAK